MILVDAERLLERLQSDRGAYMAQKNGSAIEAMNVAIGELMHSPVIEKTVDNEG